MYKLMKCWNSKNYTNVMKLHINKKNGIKIFIQGIWNERKNCQMKELSTNWEKQLPIK